MPAPPRSERQAELDALRARIQGLMEVEPPRTAPLFGRRKETPEGGLRVSVDYLEPDHMHGRIPIARARSAEAALVAELALDPAVGHIDLRHALFLDTETTGLGHGAGTVPFLIGLGWFEDESFVVEQLFLEELGEEVPMLEALRARVNRSTCLVTYNGKSYDWPLLESRYVINRVTPPSPRPHVDLLHCARRIYRRRLGGVRLVDVEDHVLGMRRERDIDGAEIPGLYWSFLRHRNGASMAPVLEHNANDLVALAAMLAHLSERFARVHHEDDPMDQLARAKLAFRAGDTPRAEAFALAAAEGGAEPGVAVEAYTLLATLAKRRKEHRKAEAAFLEAVDASNGEPNLAAPVHLELAKLYEHRLKDLRRALFHAARAAAAEIPEDHARRLARLQRRMTRAAAELRSRAG